MIENVDKEKQSKHKVSRMKIIIKMWTEINGIEKQKIIEKTTDAK